MLFYKNFLARGLSAIFGLTCAVLLYFNLVNVAISPALQWGISLFLLLISGAMFVLAKKTSKVQG